MSASTSTSQEAPSKPEAWFCTTGLPSDVVVEAGNTTFHLHRFPLVSKSAKLRELLTDLRQEPDGEPEIVEEPPRRVSLPSVPGGARTFEAAARFCYGVRLDLSPSTVVPLLCAAHFLGMSDDVSHDNLASRCDRYLQASVLRSLRASVRALRSAEPPDVAPSAEALGITQRLIDAVAARASSSDPSSLFGWPVGDGRRRPAAAGSGRSAAAESWLEELTALGLPAYKRVLSAMEASGASPDAIEASLIAYARRAIPGLLRSGRRGVAFAAVVAATEAEQLELLEAVVEHLPPRRSAATSTTRFLFGLLRVARILRASEAAREKLERKIGLQLDQATVDDLLMPSYSYDVETLYDVDCVGRLVRYFVEARRGEEVAPAEDGEGPGNPSARVGRLVDDYLSEVASDANLQAETFCTLAFALPDHARVYDDGLYRAVDVFLKAHPHIAEWERERICGVMDCQKLTLEACTHAAQNERLPLRTIVQVLFFEQLQLRHAIASTLQLHGTHPDATRLHAQPGSEGDQVLRLDMDSIRSRVHELEKECSTMKRAIEKIDRTATPGASGRASLTRKFGCKFRTQVCDSHARNIVAGTRRRVVEGQSS